MPELASLAELELHLNIDGPSATDEVELALMLSAASDLVTDIVGDLFLDTVTETVPVVGGVAILSRRPTGGVTVDGVPTLGIVRPAAGLVTGLGYGITEVAVTYPAGSAVVPAPVVLATLIIAAHLWETQRGAQPLPFSGGGDAAPPIGIGYALPNRAKELLAQYAVESVIA